MVEWILGVTPLPGALLFAGGPRESVPLAGLVVINRVTMAVADRDTLAVSDRVSGAVVNRVTEAATDRRVRVAVRRVEQ